MSTQKLSAAESRVSFQRISWQLGYLAGQLRTLSEEVESLGDNHRTRAKSMRRVVAEVASTPFEVKKRRGRKPKNAATQKG